MANTSSRTLRLLTLLQHRRYWPGEELAQKLEVSLRTVRRDVERLRDLGYPVEATRGTDGGYQLAAGASLPPLVVEDEEAIALAVGLRLAAQGAITGLEEASMSALTKVVQVLPAKLRRRAQTLQSALSPAVASGLVPVDVEMLVVIAQACRDSERLTFNYVARSGEPTERHVEPAGLVNLRGRWYLAAYDLERFDWRTFRLDRLTEPKNTKSRFRPREIPHGSISEFVHSQMKRLYAGVDQARVRLLAPVAEVQSWLGPWAQVTEADSTSCVLTIGNENPRWAAWAVMSTGVEFEVLDGEALRAELRRWAERLRGV